jgi:hypothetical protein
MKAVIVKENDKYKDWGIDEVGNEKVPQQVIEIRQAVINELGIKDSFLRKVWERRAGWKLISMCS